MHKITPNLWFDKEAKEAAEFYTSLFPDSEITNVTTLHDTPSGDTDAVSFTLAGQPFMAISAGPLFQFNPSISFMINIDPAREKDARARIDELWEKLSEGGTVLMPIDKYPFSERYGWLSDKYGVSWQLILSDPEGDERPVIVPSLLYVGEVAGRAEEAIQFYLSVFKDSKPGLTAYYPAGMEPDKEGTVMFADFMINDTWLAAMDSAREHGYTFNEAVSLMVSCDSQEEIDYYHSKLSISPEYEQCGWIKDKFGVVWQITPAEMDRMMTEGTPEQIDRVTQAFLKMKKFDIATLQKAYEDRE